MPLLQLLKVASHAISELSGVDELKAALHNTLLRQRRIEGDPLAGEVEAIIDNLHRNTPLQYQRDTLGDMLYVIGSSAAEVRHTYEKSLEISSSS